MDKINQCKVSRYLDTYYYSSNLMTIKSPTKYVLDLDAVNTVEDIKSLLKLCYNWKSNQIQITVYPEEAEHLKFIKTPEQINKESLVNLLEMAKLDVEEGRTFTLDEALENLKSKRKEILK